MDRSISVDPRERFASLVGWRAKAAGLAALSRVPFGRQIYRRLQDLFGTAAPDYAAHYAEKITVVKRVLAYGATAESRILEVGTGWHPVLPILFSAAGLRHVTSVDINVWMRPGAFEHARAGMRALAELIADDLHRPLADVTSGIDASAITFRVSREPRYGLASRSFDFAVSSNLLEHVPPASIQIMHSELAELLQPGGIVCHHINPGDHFAVDKKITTAHFLKYSRAAWYWIGGSGLSYHNRLRAVDFVELLRDSGFEILEVETHLDERALAAIRSGHLRPHSDFANYTHESLCHDIVDLVARRE